jgi:putative NIF3 family GTP cyclohydrolase 1 type 2
MPTVHDLAVHLADALDRARYHREGDPAGVWLGSDREVRRLGLRLEAGHPPFGWSGGLDAVLIHRPFGLWPARLPESFGVLAAHRALDERLSVGYSPPLAKALGLVPEGDPLMRGGKPVGMIARAPEPLAPKAFQNLLTRSFGGFEASWGGPPEAPVEAVAVVVAMTGELVRGAAERGAAVYLTGQLRPPARDAVEASGLYAVAVGQDRAEAWGLRHLAGLVRERWPEIEVVESGLPGASGA